MKYIFLFLAFLLGILLWMFWQGNLLNYTKKAADIDSLVNDILFQGGIKDVDLASQSSLEKKKSTTVWVEFYKEIKLKESVDFNAIKEKLSALAKTQQLDYTAGRIDENREFVKIGAKDKIFSRLVFIRITEAKVVSSAKRVAIVIDDVGYKPDM